MFQPPRASFVWLKARQVFHRTLFLAFIAGSLGFSFGLTGCAYRMGYGTRQLPGGYRTIAVPMFKNKSHDAGIEVYLTNAMVRELERMRIGRLAPKSEAQVTLQGTVMNILYSPVNTTLIDKDAVGDEALKTTAPAGAKINQQYIINLRVELKLVRNADQKVLWEGAFVRDQSYNTPRLIAEEGLGGANALYNHSARYQNLETMAADLMAEAHDRLTENF